MKLSSALAVVLLLLSAPAAYAESRVPGLLWQESSVSYLRGFDYELGPEERHIVTLEHASAWAYGDLFAFVDLTDAWSRGRGNYGEIHPRLSAGKISGKDFSFGPVKDVLLAAEAEIGDHGHRAYLYGVGVDLNLPGFKYFTVNVYARDQRNMEGTTWQISPAWSLPFMVGPVPTALDGFADFDGGEGARAASQLIVPQYMADVGHFILHKDNRIMAGAEWQYWHNKFGVDGVTESVVQALVKIKF